MQRRQFWTVAATTTAMGGLLLGCGSSAPPEAENPQLTPQPTATAAASAPSDVPAGHVDRAKLEGVLLQGPPWLLQRVPLEEVMKKGKFYGWRVQDLPLDWEAADLRPGDVVTSVNTMPLETPADLWAIWTTLSVASEIKIDYERNGEQLELRVPISGKADPEFATALRDPSRRSPTGGGSGHRPKQKPTIVIRPAATSHDPDVRDFSDGKP